MCATHRSDEKGAERHAALSRLINGYLSELARTRRIDELLWNESTGRRWSHSKEEERLMTARVL